MITFLQAAEVAATEEARMGLWELFTKGGWLMWPLLILGGVTIFIFVERFLAIRKASTLDMNFMNRIRDFILDGKIAAAVDLCRKTDTPIARMIEKGIERLGRPMSDVQSAIENVANLEVSKLENGLPYKTIFYGNFISRTTVFSVCSGLHLGKLFQKLRIQIRRWRNGCCTVLHKTRRSNMQCDRNRGRSNRSIAFRIVAKQTHLHRTRMQFGRQQTSRSVYAKHHVVCFLTLRELHHLVQRFPSSIEHELHRNKCDLVRSNDFSFQHFDFLLFH